ncbi:MarR family winged helix-turn-helix transcriptional regulator [Actinomadura rupiterrae]|uniref:MarR family winged helix-turn-helix transcriptional regulator n=1 Tax=Actinomadura rupiterrae TaxID=559627 RepID=UPI0020A393AE|nr:MarR family transcriptional regulator [Actinomadura rupiterrae]MCP2334783.1 DNA-binding MarR family transcriptional regulator [Actinomadura rupiterrae]
MHPDLDGAAGHPADPFVTAADPLVTGIHDRWDGQGLPGQPWPYMAICSVGRLYQLIKKALDGELERCGLSRTGFFLLTTLALTSEGRARLSTLSRFLMLHPTSVKLTVDQLEADGLAARAPHPNDRRATLVLITPAGRELAGRLNLALESPDGPFGDLAGLYRPLFESLQPMRLAAGDLEL